MPDVYAIANAVPRIQNAKILVLGDFCLDKYLYIDRALDELSVETDLVAYQVTRKALFAGAAGTVTANLRALGASVICVGWVGEDGEGYELRRCLQKLGADDSGLISCELCTNTYTKPMRQDEAGRWTELNRLDFRTHTPIPAALEEALCAALTEKVAGVDAVVVCDQFVERNCGAVSDRVRDHLAALAEQYPNLLFYADSRGWIAAFRNCVVKCNHLEALRCTGLPEGASVEECAMALYARNQKPVIITLGEEGSLVCDGQCQRIPPVKVTGEIDICGAGDANSAGYVLGRVCGLSNADASYLGNVVSSITIRQIGVTGTASPEQVLVELQRQR